jgi:L-iditol 2-dehydrogenase
MNGESMKFAVIVSERQAEIHERPRFALNPNQVLIQNKTCNICTTDYQQWMGLRKHQLNPKAFGHENAGIVVERGKDVSNVKVGDHVVQISYGPCLECRNCRRGKPTFCCEYALGKKFNNQKDDCGYYGSYGCGEYQTAFSKYVFRIGDDLAFEHGGFVEPLASVLYGLKCLRVQAGQSVLVIGAGTMGVLNAQVARYFGADVVISELSKKKLSTVKRLGFEKTVNPADVDFDDRVIEYTGGEGPDAVIIAVGLTAAYNQAIGVAPMGCRFLIYAAGYPPPAWNLHPNDVHYKLWQIIGTYGSTLADWQESAQLLSKGAIDVSPLIEKRYALANIQRAFEHAATPGSYRVCVELE